MSDEAVCRTAAATPGLLMTGKGWRIDLNCWIWLELSGTGEKCLEMDQMDGNDWKYLYIDKNG